MGQGSGVGTLFYEALILHESVYCVSILQVASYAVEPSVLCQVMDEITTDWQKNRYTFTMALSSSATDLYSLVGKKAGE